MARGLCSTHYNRTRANRHVKRAMPCAWCGTTVVKLPRSEAVYGVVCSTACRGHLLGLALRGEAKSGSSALVHIPRAARQDRRPRPANSVRKRWFAGDCVVCGDKFVSETTARTCSEQCAEQRFVDQRRAGKHARRARMKAAFVSHVSPLAIYRRDGWQCWLCLSAIDPHADPQGDHGPSLDHIIPLANGGTHEPANVRACHRGCNARRSNHPTLTSREGERVAVLF